MTQKFFNSEKAAEVLGVSIDEVKAMRERRELHGYRDGADWKYKAEDVEKLAAERAGGGGEEEVLHGDDDFSLAEPGGSGTVVGGPDDQDSASDIRIAGSDIQIAGSDIELVGSDVELSDSNLTKSVDTPAGGEEGIELAPAEDAASGEDAAAGEKKGDSSVSLADDDLVLGGSGSGSDITIGSDSGIQLVDPTDSGLSLEEPVDLVEEGEGESLELGEDDLLAIDDSNIQQEGAADNGDFLLTPMEEVGDAEDSESGSQVIALEEEAGDEDATMIGDVSDVGAAPMLDEDVAMDQLGPGSAPRLTPEPAMAPQDYEMGAPVGAAALPESPFTTMNVVSLALCAFLLALGGMMMFDLLRNMWSWDAPYTLNSWIMDLIVGG